MTLQSLNLPDKPILNVSLDSLRKLHFLLTFLQKKPSLDCTKCFRVAFNFSSNFFSLLAYFFPFRFTSIAITGVTLLSALINSPNYREIFIFNIPPNSPLFAYPLCTFVSKIISFSQFFESGFLRVRNVQNSLQHWNWLRTEHSFLHPWRYFQCSLSLNFMCFFGFSVCIFVDAFGVGTKHDVYFFPESIIFSRMCPTHSTVEASQFLF